MPRVIFNPKILKGKAIIKGTRISAEFVIELLSSGMSIEEILKEYSHLKKEDILAALNYAAKTLKQKIAVSSELKKKKMYEYWLEQIIEELYGKRCPDYAKECACCQAWGVYDTIIDYNKGKL